MLKIPKNSNSTPKIRRKKVLLKDSMLNLLAQNVSSQLGQHKIAEFGLNPDNTSNTTLLTAALFMKAVEDGSVPAFKEIRDLIGEAIPTAPATNREKPDPLSESLKKLAGDLDAD